MKKKPVPASTHTRPVVTITDRAKYEQHLRDVARYELFLKNKPLCPVCGSSNRVVFNFQRGEAYCQDHPRAFAERARS